MVCLLDLIFAALFFLCGLYRGSNSPPYIRDRDFPQSLWAKRGLVMPGTEPQPLPEEMVKLDFFSQKGVAWLLSHRRSG
jgi:hypothetical protein